jgi:serine/threonine protein phosphatase PrpC
VTDQSPPDAPRARAPEPGQASWAQPPAAAESSAGWAQPPSSRPRRLHGSTEARIWTANPELAAQAEADAAADHAAWAPAPTLQSHAPVRTFTPTVQSCPRCGGEIDFDGYCQQCGAKAPTVREHFEESPSDWVAGICDRGIRHSRNEDAMALQATPHVGGRAVLAVCDGVSMSAASDQASLAAARAAVDHVTEQAGWEWDLGDLAPGSPTRALLEGLVLSANQAVLENSDLSESSPASCTLAVGLVAGRRLVAVTLGDSRVYWLPDAGSATLLSTDDSMAQEQIEAGIDRELAETGVHGHVITKWLGRDAPDLTPNVSGTLAEGPGWLMVCTDGLWNYASGPDQMAALVGHYSNAGLSQPLALAHELVTWANEQGGHDNITVALARVDRPPAAEAPPAAGQATEPDPADTPTTRTRPVGADRDR